MLALVATSGCTTFVVEPEGETETEGGSADARTEEANDEAAREVPPGGPPDEPYAFCQDRCARDLSCLFIPGDGGACAAPCRFREDCPDPGPDAAEPICFGQAAGEGGCVLPCGGDIEEACPAPLRCTLGLFGGEERKLCL